MKIISWNVRGMGAPPKRVLIKDFLIKVDPDLVILQETKLAVVDRKVVKAVWSLCRIGWVALDAEGSVGGILIMWNEDTIAVEDSILVVFSISLKIRYCQGFCGWVMGVYGPSSSRNRDGFWKELFDFVGSVRRIGA